MAFTECPSKADSAMGSLYDVRNAVVHEYRSTLTVPHDTWIQLNFELMSFIIDCTIGYEDAGDLHIPLEFLRAQEATT